MNLGRRNRVKAEGGMSSMTDLVFLMLIFFIIMSTMAQKGVPVDLPSGENSNVPEPNTINVGVTENNTYILDEDPDVEYSFEEIEPLIVAKMEANVGNDNIKISGDKNADYEYVFRLIALAKQKQWKPILIFK